MLVVDALHPAEEAVDDHVEAGLLAHLADDGLVQALAEVHPARRGPTTPPPPARARAG